VLRLVDVDDPGSLVIEAANPAAHRLLGITAGRLDGARLRDLLTDATGADLAQHLAETVRVGVGYDTELTFATDDGSRQLAVRSFPLTPPAVGVTLSDATVRAEAEARLRHLALHDGLTSLPNRLMLGDRLRAAIAAASRHGGELSLLSFDLDRFKEVNDRYGHHAGDELLATVARRLRERLRQADTIARLGGDEFAVLITTGAGGEGTIAVAEAIRAAVAEPIQVEGYIVNVSASIGIAHFPEHAGDADGLSRRADEAMYRAKRGGVAWVVWDPLSGADDVSRVRLAAELPAAIGTGQLVLHHQPIVDLIGGGVTRTEALVRWQHPRLGLLHPDDFLDHVEEAGLGHALTRWVVARVVRELDTLEPAGHGGGLSVNVSRGGLAHPELAELVLDASAATGRTVTVEVSERVLARDPIGTSMAIRRLANAGVAVSLDDVGTGRADLTTLSGLPLTEIKVDGELVAAAPSSEASRRALRAVFDLGRSLGITVVAEGVEDEVVLALLVELGCQRAQGFHLGSPLPALELGHVLRTGWFRRVTEPGGATLGG